MQRALPIQEYLRLARESARPIFDVRTPAEYARGHIPGAINLPLFTNEERAEIGTLYVQESREEAIKRGLEFIGPRMRELIEVAEARALHDPETEAQNLKGSVLVHCWRGGMRSGAVAWLFGFYGLEAITLTGGYKSYRRYILDEVFPARRNIILLGGRTGAGKTETLHSIAEQPGEQVIDLEGLAQHRGSAFGALGYPAQPTQEQFENELAYQLMNTEPERPLWLESENRAIGRLALPNQLYAQMETAPLVALEVPREKRIERLAREYGEYPLQALQQNVDRIQQRLGGLRHREATQALQAGNIARACEVLLDYYDRAYDHAAAKRPGPTIARVESASLDAATNATLILDATISRSQNPNAQI